MSLRLQGELQSRLEHWLFVEWDAERRVDSYQRDLLELHQISPLPFASIELKQHMCAAAIKSRDQAASYVAELRSKIRQLPHTATSDTAK